MNELPFINGQKYNWSTIEVCVLDQVLTGITSVNYNDSLGEESHYEIDGFPVFSKSNAYEAKASITLDQDNVNVILKVLSEDEELQNIPAFDIVVSYLNNDNIITQVVRNCEFTTNSLLINQKNEVALDLICSHIEWN
ncbi:hypothetical protein GCM10011344_32110 [Dokdonia pacifica]|uniref:Uncharacterized protein n=1 Tax=Dokdonia pacifica TaxID=1627892 RepID=A0A239BMB5_9FLAO|nr:hypothetical protein [Dokdonia pacifica]GGG28862.1 hypothetical protein GCM10011344_32110 [Dokdonia pacifica]SNS08488.1 hypothetical protein SAMN06265376_106256 [Dokdonia pacifica]